MADRDEVQIARWTAIREQVGVCLRAMRSEASQARLSGDLEDLGYHVTQSMISRYEQGVLDAPLSRERMVGWALCCQALSSAACQQMLELAGHFLPWPKADLKRFDETLQRARALPLPDQIILRRKLLWHILGVRELPTPAPVEAIR